MKDGHSPSTYVIIDLGSSSFHLQAVQMLPVGPRPLLRIKRKVYLIGSGCRQQPIDGYH